MRKILVLIVVVLCTSAPVTAFSLGFGFKAPILGQCCIAVSYSECADGTRAGLFGGCGYDCSPAGCRCVGGCRKKKPIIDYDPYPSNYEDDGTEPKRRSLELPAYAKTINQCVEDTIHKVGTNVLTSLEDISTYFQCFDTNGNGLLTTDDPIFSEIMASGNDSIITSFKSLDKNGNGIDLYEFAGSDNATYALDASNHASMHAAGLPLLVSAAFVALSYVS